MLVGLIADTHDRVYVIEKAVKVLNERGVEMVLHAGDYIAPFMAKYFGRLEAKAMGVFGNNDGDVRLLSAKLYEVGLELRGRFAEVRADGLRIALLHGDEAELLNSLISCGGYDVVVHGHTHKAESHRRGRTLVVNPGEVCGYLSGKCTIAILDTEKMEAEFIELKP